MYSKIAMLNIFAHKDYIIWPYFSGRSSIANDKDRHYFLNMFVCVGEFFDGRLNPIKANSSSKLSVVRRASQCHGIRWWSSGIDFAFSALSFSFTDSLFQLHRFSISAWCLSLLLC